MNNKICCFAGHATIYDSDIKTKIKDAVMPLITECGVTEFWCGNYGAFDHSAAAVIRSLKEQFSHISLCLVIPYLTNEINEYSDDYQKNSMQL